MSSAGALALVEPKHIISRYLAGEVTDDIAKSLGVTRQGLNWHLRHNAEEEWKDAQIVLATERKDKAQEAMDNLLASLQNKETPRDALSLACIREQTQLLKEQLKSAQWDLERVLKRIYGPSQEVTGKDGGPLTVELVSFASTQIEGEVVREPIADAQSTAALPNK